MDKKPKVNYASLDMMRDLNREGVSVPLEWKVNALEDYDPNGEYAHVITGSMMANPISGSKLVELIDREAKDYEILYPSRGIKDYCLCGDIGITDCHGMITVMDVLKKDSIEGIPEITQIIKKGRYQSGDVWLNGLLQITYLYVGKTKSNPNGIDIIINLGGDTNTKLVGTVELARLDFKYEKRVLFDKKIFPPIKNKFWFF
jgi:hypothetical protein